MAPLEYHLIGNWRFDIDEALLRNEEGARPLEDRAARTLAVLCRRRGEIVARDELLAEVWQGRTVSPNSVAIVIGDLRRALDDDTRSPAYIVTVAKRGYRLNTEPEQPPKLPEPERPQPPGQSGRRNFRRMAAGIVLVLAVAIVGLPKLSSQRRTLVVEPVSNDTGVAIYQPLASALSAVVTDRTTRFASIRMISSDAKSLALSGAPDLQMISRLILWNGAPELALKAIDGRTGTVIWSAFATGPAADLARSTSLRLDELDRKLHSKAELHGK
ncbi:MAG: winged helix-turn-helix domain-containing protein [Janthinobacterium lividum]